jgi:hypothetical protein
MISFVSVPYLCVCVCVHVRMEKLEFAIKELQTWILALSLMIDLNFSELHLLPLEYRNISASSGKTECIENNI